MTETKKSNTLLAFLVSMLAACAGGVVFGIIYCVGYYMYFLAIAEIVLACTVFFKFKPAKNWKIILLAIVWCVVWTFICNFIAIVIGEAVLVAKEYSLTISEAFNLVLELWQNEPDVEAYMNERMLQVVAMIALGGIVYGVYFGINKAKVKKLNNQHAQAATNNTQPQTENKLANVYFNVFNSCKNIYNIFVKDKNKETFKQNLETIKTTHIQPLTEKEKAIIKTNLEKKLAKEETTTEDKNICKILLTIVK